MLVLATLLIGSVLAGSAVAGKTTPTASDPLRTALEHGLRPAVLKAGEAAPGWSLQQRMAHYHVPGVAIALVRDGIVVDAAGYGVRVVGGDARIDADTLFSVGSISKIVAAATSLRLVTGGRIDLDRNVNEYMKSWQITPAPGIVDPVVTLRMLLSHTSGLGVHGFEDYPPGAALPSLLDTLDGRAPAKNEAVRLKHPPGTRGDYSGGGVMVEQLVLETVSGRPLDALARAEVFTPLGMRRSTYGDPGRGSDGNIAHAHDAKGTAVALPRGWESFPEAAASGLWTSANDLGALVAALLRSYRGDDPFLPRPIAVEMMTEVATSWHGLGPRLDGAGATRIFHHGGANDSYRAWIEGYLETGDGFVILTNGASGGALMLEIRNALSDALARGVNPPLRTLAPDPGRAPLADTRGRYRLDPATPMALRRGLADYFDADELVVTLADGALALAEAGAKPVPLLPLAPYRFALQGTLDPPQIEFHRDAHGRVSGFSVDRGSAHAWYPRDTPEAAAGAQARQQIEGVVEAFRRAIIDKDRKRFAALFLHDNIPWQDVSSDRDLQHMRQQRPDARKVVFDPKDTWRAFIDDIAADTESKEERFRNLRIDTDGDIATVGFDYSFHAGGRETNHGREAWQLVNTDDGWKIISVIYSVNRLPETGPRAVRTEVAAPVDGGGR